MVALRVHSGREHGQGSTGRTGPPSRRPGGLLSGGGDLLGGSGLSATVAAAGPAHSAQWASPSPICLLGVGPLLGSIATGRPGAPGLAVWLDSGPTTMRTGTGTVVKIPASSVTPDPATRANLSIKKERGDHRRPAQPSDSRTVARGGNGKSRGPAPPTGVRRMSIAVGKLGVCADESPREVDIFDVCALVDDRLLDLAVADGRA